MITTNIDTKDEEKVYETILHGKGASFMIVNVGAMRTNDEATQGYYLVKWITKPYTLQENTVKKGEELQRSSFVVEIICDAVFWKPVPNAIDWYTPMSNRERLIMIRLK